MSVRPDYVEALINQGLFLLAMVFEKMDGSVTGGLKYEIRAECGVSIDTVTFIYNLTPDQITRLHQYEDDNREKLMNYLDNRLRTEADLRRQLSKQRELAVATITRYVLAFLLITFSLGYVYALTFYEIPLANQRFADAFGGILIGCVFQNVLAFFFNADTSKNPFMKKALSPSDKDDIPGDEE